MSARTLPAFCSEVVRHDAVPVASLAWAHLPAGAAALAHAISLCMPEDVTRAGRQRFEVDRHRAIVRRATARRLLALQWRRPARAVRLLRRPTGQPFSPDLPGSVSISYADNIVLVATSARHAIGCDIARPLPGIGVWPREDSMFAAREVAWMRAREADGEGAAAFIRIWTLKEARGKATGEGLLKSLNHFDTTMVPDAPSEIWLAGSCWLSRRWEWPGGYHVAMIVAGSDLDAITERSSSSGERELDHAG